MNLRALLLVLCALCVSCLGSGCVALIAAKQRAALPPGHVGAGKVVVNIPIAGGGSLEVKDAAKGADGSLKAAEYHSQIQTSYGMVEVHLLDVQIDGKPPRKK